MGRNTTYITTKNNKILRKRAGERYTNIKLKGAAKLLAAKFNNPNWFVEEFGMNGNDALKNKRRFLKLCKDMRKEKKWVKDNFIKYDKRTDRRNANKLSEEGYLDYIEERTSSLPDVTAYCEKSREEFETYIAIIEGYLSEEYDSIDNTIKAMNIA